MRGVCFCEKAHFSFFIYPHVVLRNSTPFSFSPQSQGTALAPPATNTPSC